MLTTSHHVRVLGRMQIHHLTPPGLRESRVGYHQKESKRFGGDRSRERCPEGAVCCPGGAECCPGGAARGLQSRERCPPCRNQSP